MKFFSPPYTFLPLKERFLYFLRVRFSPTLPQFRETDRFLLKTGQVFACFSSCNLSRRYLDGLFSYGGHQLHVRLRRNSSDPEVFYQIFIEEEYLRSIRLIREKVQLPETPLIIDAGANIGLAALYFSLHFTGCRLQLLEPFEENAASARENIQRNHLNAEVLQAALWQRETELQADFSFRDGKEWSVTVLESPQGPIQGITPAMLLPADGSTIDILKVDIEGSEFPVFLDPGAPDAMLRNTRALIMEIHDDKGDREQLKAVFAKNNFECIELGELSLFLNRSFMHV